MKVLKETEFKPGVAKEEYTNQIDINQFIGKPLSEFLKKIGQKRLYVEYSSKNFFGASGLSGMTTNVDWSVANNKILEIAPGGKDGDFKYQDYYIKVA